MPGVTASDPRAEQSAPRAQRPEPDMDPALDRLLLCNQVRELADFHGPVTIHDAPRPGSALARLVRRACGAGPASAPRGGWLLLRRVAADALLLIGLRVWLSRGRVWRVARTTAGALARLAVFHQQRYHAQPASQITGYVNVTDEETALIRVALLLRTMKRFGACIDLLLQRLRSGRPAQETRQWLAFFLREAGDPGAADRLAPARGRPEAPERLDRYHRTAAPAPAAGGAARLKYGLVMPTMFDADIFRSSLLSLLESDFPGQIVVVEDGNAPARACEAFCKPLPVRYVKNPRWGGPSGTLDLGIRHLDADADIVVFAHNDALFPRRWFAQLDHAWEVVFASGKVSMINLGYLQIPSSLDPALNELFLRRRHEDLLWLLRMRRDIPPALEHFQALDSTDPGRRFGLGRDNWGEKPHKVQFMTGKSSVAASFPVQSWRELGGLRLDMPFGTDMELQWHGCLRRQWNLWINNTPLIHLVSGDTGTLRGQAHATYAKMSRDTYERFAEHYGVAADHFYWLYFSQMRMVHQDAIVDAVNEQRFADVDFVFDELQERLKTATAASCEFPWCRSRAVCPYPATPGGAG